MPFVPNRVGPYLEQRILSADPLDLVVISYQSLIQAIREAREHGARRQAQQRRAALQLALNLLGHLSRTLDLSAGNGSLPRELNKLYDYMARRLLIAGQTGADQPLGEVLGLLEPLLNGWQQIAQRAKPASKPILTPLATVSQPWESADAQSLPTRYSLSC